MLATFQQEAIPFVWAGGLIANLAGRHDLSEVPTNYQHLSISKGNRLIKTKWGQKDESKLLSSPIGRHWASIQ